MPVPSNAMRRAIGTAAVCGLLMTAAAAAATSCSNDCAAIRPFYWEIGDRDARLAGASVNAAGNAQTYAADSLMSIASASKWLYGAYVAERRHGALSTQDIAFLNFTSGYISFSNYQRGDTVGSCEASGSNGVLSPGAVGRFSYGGGHMQKHASLAPPGMDLGAMDAAALAVEMRRVLGNDIQLSYAQPQLAGGVVTTAADYALFLRKLLAGQLALGGLLGSDAVCTNPATCPTALNTPVLGDLDWHYSIGHWVEDDPSQGDGAFSSAGAFGFYPWIDASKTWYGIVARSDFSGAAGNASAACGALIRKAWIGATVPR